MLVSHLPFSPSLFQLSPTVSQVVLLCPKRFFCFPLGSALIASLCPIVSRLVSLPPIGVQSHCKVVGSGIVENFFSTLSPQLSFSLLPTCFLVPNSGKLPGFDF